MYLIDTDFLSQTIKDQPLTQVLRWFQEVDEQDTFISVVSLEEIQNGLDLMPEGRRKTQLSDWLESDVLMNFSTRTLTVDTAIARECGRMMARAKKNGHTTQLGDALIAATAKVHELHVATLNLKHYEPFGISVVAL